MRRAVDAEELLDGPLDDPAASCAATCATWSGPIDGWAASACRRAGIDALAGDRETLTVLDVGTGGADIPLALLARAARAGRRLRITGIDSRPEVLAAAVARQSAPDGDADGLELQVGDGQLAALSGSARSTSRTPRCVVHHLDPAEAVSAAP